MKKAKKAAKRREWINFNNAIILIIVLSVVAILRAMIPADTAITIQKANLEREAIEVLDAITDENMPISILKSNELVEEKVVYLEQMNYDEIKSMLGIKSDFCIFFEDVTGNLVNINDIKSGIGSTKIHINGEPCK